MKKSINVKDQYIPHPMQLFLVGTYDENKEANFGMFCWLNFCWDEELCATVCMDGEKATKTHIKENSIFSACLVTSETLEIANKLASTKGDEKKELISKLPIEKGSVLDVPILSDSPYCYEFKVKKTIELDGSDIFVCEICNTLISTDNLDGQEYSISNMKPIIISQKEYLTVNPFEDCKLL